MNIIVMQGSILEADVQAIVNAANSSGYMGGGVAGAIKRAAGVGVEQEAVRQAPIPVGSAVLTSGGATKFAHIIHAPTMPQSGMAIPAANVALATRAALRLADEKGLASIALPGMGTGVGGVAPGDAAAVMLKEIKEFQGKSLRSVILVDVDPEMVRAWNRNL